MPAEIHDVLKINIVLVGANLLDTSKKFERFSAKVSTDVAPGLGLALGGPGLIPAPGRKLKLQRDRISLDLMPNHAAVEREYPSKSDLPRLAEVAGAAIQSSELQGKTVTAFGYNIDLVFEQQARSSALEYLGDRLFTTVGFAQSDWKLVGGLGQLTFDSSDGRWTIRLEPRSNMDSSRGFVSLNLHKEEQRLPPLREIKQSFVQVWSQAHDLVKRLDESVR